MKAVFFGFDGTLTSKGSNVWKNIWKKCGCFMGSSSYYNALYKKFLLSEISYQEWCDLTCEVFKKAKFSRKDLIEIAKEIQLIDGLEETLKALKQKGYKLFIVSGGISSVIRMVLGDKIKYFDAVKANVFQFDENGIIDSIKGTNYDYKDKAKFISEFKKATKSQAKDLFFVGNGDNDEWAHLAGCKTICINPVEADFTNSLKWHKNIGETSNLTSILGCIIPNAKNDICK